MAGPGLPAGPGHAFVSLTVRAIPPWGLNQFKVVTCQNAPCELFVAQLGADGVQLHDPLIEHVSSPGTPAEHVTVPDVAPTHGSLIGHVLRVSSVHTHGECA